MAVELGLTDMAENRLITYRNFIVVCSVSLTVLYSYQVSNYESTVRELSVCILNNKMHKILVIRLYFLLDALHVSDCISPSLGRMVPAYTKCDVQFIKECS